MELWDREVEPYRHTLERLDAVTLSNLAFDAIEAAIPLIGPPFEGFFPPDHAALIEIAIAFRRDHPTDWQFDSRSAKDFLARYDDLPDAHVRPAVGPFFMTLVRLFEAPPNLLSAEDAMEILSSCYESVLMSHLRGRITLEDERNSHQCVAAIGRQIEIIGAHA
ncbi:hypothetical protein OG594_34435 [Streptomyces sp. NBC_01214]|uniref:hypothetical protein n=1 Tax=Streptomyces sp. NBC_01214 TaxID=2903777 RepID=UPI002252923F|nr:hypothetical protein [Streptomyces sp. NBC_01214]MCX4806664.1 hypothetical protein [Streptomyces sp. NBC_01214]